MEQFTEEQAIALAKSGEWKDWADEEVVKFQLFQKLLCMDFSRFHEAMEHVLGRQILLHEFAFSNQLKDEYLGIRPQPTFDEIINLIPEEKRMVLFVE